MKNKATKKLQSLLPSKNWWSNLACGFLGSCFGIIVTFGTSQYMESRTQKEIERKLLVLSLAEIDNQIKEMERISQHFKREKNIYTYIDDHEVEEMREDSIGSFVAIFWVGDFTVTSPQTESLIDNNIEAMKNISDLSLLTFINKGKSIQKEFYNVISKENEERKEIFHKVSEKKLLYDYDTLQEFMHSVKDTPDMSHYILMHSLYSGLLGKFTKQMKKVKFALSKRTGITDKEIKKAQANFTFFEQL